MTFPPPLGLVVQSRWFPRDTGTEPRVLVNPRDPDHWVAAFIADFSVSQLVAVTRDAGRTWHQATIPQLGACTGGEDEGSFDPWLSRGPDGALYLSFMVAELPRTGFSPLNGIAVSRSDDGGTTWSPPVLAEPNDRQYNDKPTLLADPAAPGRVAVIWTKFDGSNRVFSAQSSDAGKSWERRLVYAPSGGAEFGSSDIVALPDGTWLYSFLLRDGEQQPRVGTFRSPDAGQSWSDPHVIGESTGLRPRDPDDGAELTAPPFPSAAVGPAAEVYLTWHRIDSATSSRILLSRSTDGGRTWSAPAPVVESSAQAFQPNVAVLPDGTVGLLFYDTATTNPATVS
jgi:hypothetical protein